MSTGGTVSIKNPTGKTLAVTVTPASGTVAFLKSGGGTASFPETITGDETFTCTNDCVITVSVKYAGVEIAGSPDATLGTELRNGVQCIIQPTPDGGYDFEPTILLTTTNIASAAHAINAAGKYQGKQIFNVTTGKPLWASGPVATDPWKDATATTAHTPS